MGKFQISLQHHYENSDAVPLCDPGLMKEFADKSALSLFGSISVSGQLPTYPSPNSTTVN